MLVEGFRHFQTPPSGQHMITHAPSQSNTSSLSIDAYNTYRSLRFFANLDGLRFLCISMVVWHHATPISLSDLKLENRGFLGVDFFLF